MWPKSPTLHMNPIGSHYDLSNEPLEDCKSLVSTVKSTLPWQSSHDTSQLGGSSITNQCLKYWLRNTLLKSMKAKLAVWSKGNQEPIIS